MDGIVSFAQNHTVMAIVLAPGLVFFCIPQTEIVFRPSLPRSLPGGIVLYDHQHG